MANNATSSLRLDKRMDQGHLQRICLSMAKQGKSQKLKLNPEVVRFLICPSDQAEELRVALSRSWSAIEVRTHTDNMQ